MTDYLRKAPLWTAAAQQRAAAKISDAITPPTPREQELAARLADETAARIRAESAMDAACLGLQQTHTTIEDLLDVIKRIGGYMKPEDQEAVWVARGMVKA